MRLWRDFTRIFFASPAFPTSNAKRERSNSISPSRQIPDAAGTPTPARVAATPSGDEAGPTLGPLDTAPDPLLTPIAPSIPIEPFGGALIHCSANAVIYTPLVDSVPAAPPKPSTSDQLTPARAPPTPSDLRARHDSAQIDHDTARRDHEIAKEDHANAQRDHAAAQADAALSRQDLRAFEEDVARAQQALDAHSVVEQIQRRMRVRPWHMLFGAAAIVATLVLGSLGERLIGAIVAVGSVATFLWLHFRWLARRAFRLHYELGASYDRAYADLLIACRRLESAGAEWCVARGVKDPGSVSDRVKDPQTLLQRASRRFRVSRACPPWIRCNLTPPMIPTHGRKLYLFPDHALLFERGRVRAIVYTDMRFTTLPLESAPVFGPPRPDKAARGPVAPTQRTAAPFMDAIEPDGIRSQTVGRIVTSQFTSRVRRVLNRRWTIPISGPDTVGPTQIAPIESRSLAVAPPTGVNLNALHVSQLNWTGPAGPDTIHLISPGSDAIALTNAVSRLGSVYAAGLRRTHDLHR